MSKKVHFPCKHKPNCWLTSGKLSQTALSDPHWTQGITHLVRTQNFQKN